MRWNESEVHFDFQIQDRLHPLHAQWVLGLPKESFALWRDLSRLIPGFYHVVTTNWLIDVHDTTITHAILDRILETEE